MFVSDTSNVKLDNIQCVPGVLGGSSVLFLQGGVTYFEPVCVGCL